MKEWMNIAIPTILTNLVRLVTNFTDTSFLGHLNYDKEYPDAKSYDFLGGSSYSLIWINTVGIMLYTGFPNAFQTLASQAKGANNYTMIKVWLKITIVVNIIFMIPILIAFAFTGDVLLLLFSPSNCNNQC